jgi:hypothetical protein
MKKLCFLALVTIVALSNFVPAKAEYPKEIVDRFSITSKIEGCDIDMKQHCRDVTAGENREILCLAAHEDHLLNACRTGLIEAAMALQLGVASLDYAHTACEKDRLGVCGNVKAGEGRLINCMRNNESKISNQCTTALKETGFWNATIEPSSGE